MSAVLTSVEQATPDWLTGVLRERGVLSGGRVMSVDSRVSTILNSYSYHLEVSYSADAPADAPRRLFLKMSKEPEWGMEEVAFYRFVQDKRTDLPMLAPCYDAAYSEESGMSHLLLADLSTTHITPVTKAQLLAGETMPSQEHLEQMVDAIADFHAYWWEHPQLGKGFASIRTQLDGADAYRQYTERRKREWSIFTEQAVHLITAEERALYENALSHFAALRDLYLADRFGTMRAVTLSQGDCYFIQFLCPLVPEQDTAYLIDFDSVSANLPAYDLVYMFATFWTPEQRREMGREANLLRRYHNALLAHGVEGYGWHDLMMDYRLCVLYMAFDPVWDQTSGASQAYWLPKLRCLTGAFRDLDCLSLLS
jgi:thiamine kinase-like enzyme